MVPTSRYFCQFCYQGTHYHGWQIQQNARTVQQVIQECMAQLLQRDVKLVGSSRTDTGVHARGQVAHVDLPANITLSTLHYRLNLLLPADIALVALYPVQPTAHARFSAVARTYEYTITPTKDPLHAATCYWFRQIPSLAKMNEAASMICTKRDFTSCSKTGSAPSHCLCTVMEAAWHIQSEKYLFRIKANRFVRGMVRILVHQLLQVGTGALTIAELAARLDKKDRSVALGLVPACGLTLTAVDYPPTIGG